VPGSNWPPDDYKSTALPNELTRHNKCLNLNIYNDAQNNSQ
jgi:hypothetical protein